MHNVMSLAQKRQLRAAPNEQVSVMVNSWYVTRQIFLTLSSIQCIFFSPIITAFQPS